MHRYIGDPEKLAEMHQGTIDELDAKIPAAEQRLEGMREQRSDTIIKRDMARKGLTADGITIEPILPDHDSGETPADLT